MAGRRRRANRREDGAGEARPQGDQRDPAKLHDGPPLAAMGGTAIREAEKANGEPEYHAEAASPRKTFSGDGIEPKRDNGTKGTS